MPDNEANEQEDEEYGRRIIESLERIGNKLDTVLERVRIPEIATEVREITEPVTEPVHDIASEGTEILIPPKVEHTHERKFRLGVRR